MKAKFSNVTVCLSGKDDGYCFYTLHHKDKLIFSGDDYRPSPLHEQVSYDSVMGLLRFLLLKPGDTDDDYFKDYSSRQLNFINSTDASDLNAIVMQYEEDDCEM